MRLEVDGRTLRFAVVRQAHHWGGGSLAAGAAIVLSLSKDGRTRPAPARTERQRGAPAMWVFG
jgi:hypothetical protein